MSPLLLLIFMLVTSASALVTIAPVDIGSAPGISGTITGSISSKSGNTEKDEYALGGRLQYDQAIDYLVWGDVSYHYGESRGEKNEDNAYAHLRYLHTLMSPDTNAELFGQLQQDQFRDIQERSLVGGGCRWRFFNEPEQGKGYGGIGIMGENIRYSNPDINPAEHNTRMNAYLAYTLSFATSSKLNYLGYYQPKVDEFNDYITSHSLELIIPIYGPLDLNLRANYSYDSDPAVGIYKKDTAVTTTLLYRF